MLTMLNFALHTLLTLALYRGAHAQDWLAGKRGIFTHYLNGLQNSYGPNSNGENSTWSQCVEEFNATLYAEGVASTGADYAVITIMQGSIHMLAPNQAYDFYSGYPPGFACSERDLVLDLSAALSARGVRLMLYYTGDGPHEDAQASAGLGWPEAPVTRANVPLVFSQRWGQVLAEYALRYGDRVSGWWVDGCYARAFNYTDEKLQPYSLAVRAGNNDSLLALNNGVIHPIRRYSAWEDYTCGESNDFSEVPTAQFVQGSQWHTLGFLGSAWASPGVRYNASALGAYVRAVNAALGAVTVDVQLLRNGSINAQQLAVLTEAFRRPSEAGAQGAGAAPACRDRFLWPFSPASIWNTPIGSSARYVPAGIYSAELPAGLHNDQEFLARASPTDPLSEWIDDSGNFPGGCAATGAVRARLPLPPNFTTDCVPNNNGAGVLLPNNLTLVQMQPFYRPQAGGAFRAWYHTGAPQPFPWEVDVLGDGALGAHGGSGLSSFGGAIRMGELLDTTGPIMHALKLELWAHRYYYFNFSSRSPASCYRWPAVGCDSYCCKDPASGYGGTIPALVPGALLAVPPALAASLAPATVPGAKILAALTDYGGYLVDDTGSRQGGGAFCAESGVNEEVERAYGYSIRIENPLTPQQGGALFSDLVAIFKALHVVDNNAQGSVGGGGAGRQPPAPPICD